MEFAFSHCVGAFRVEQSRILYTYAQSKGDGVSVGSGSPAKEMDASQMRTQSEFSSTRRHNTGRGPAKTVSSSEEIAHLEIKDCQVKPIPKSVSQQFNAQRQARLSPSGSAKSFGLDSVLRRFDCFYFETSE